jgi:hypothetical protein
MENWATARLDAVAILFEGREFVWHPPMRREGENGLEEFGPMVSLVVAADDDSVATEEALQRFLSVVSFRYSAPVEDVSHGASGETDPFNPFGTRALRYFIANQVIDAPRGIAVTADKNLWLALALYREGVSAASAIYQCLCFKNILDVVFAVREEGSTQARRRDEFINENSGLFAEWHKLPRPSKGWAFYFRDEIRNAAAHVIRPPGRRVLNPDRPRERLALRSDAAVLANLASEALSERWPNAVTVTRRKE